MGNSNRDDYGAGHAQPDVASFPPSQGIIKKHLSGIQLLRQDNGLALACVQ
jgi:hypothetical protein